MLQTTICNKQLTSVFICYFRQNLFIITIDFYKRAHLKHPLQLIVTIFHENNQGEARRSRYCSIELKAEEDIM